MKESYTREEIKEGRRILFPNSSRFKQADPRYYDTPINPTIRQRVASPCPSCHGYHITKNDIFKCGRNWGTYKTSDYELKTEWVKLEQLPNMHILTKVKDGCYLIRSKGKSQIIIKNTSNSLYCLEVEGHYEYHKKVLTTENT